MRIALSDREHARAMGTCRAAFLKQQMTPDDRPESVVALVRDSAMKKILFLSHAVSQMSRPDRMITVEEVRRVVVSGELIEDYPEDVRGHSCLMLGLGDESRPIHVVCAPKDGYLAVITAYLPDQNEWEAAFRVRKKV